MIVKNEAHCIERCMRSAAPFVNTYCICDTGSTDKTKQIIFDTMTSLGIFGVIHDHPWENFSHNRSLSLKCSREHCPDGWSWILDADDQLKGPPLSTQWWDAQVADSLSLHTKFRGVYAMYRPQVFSNRIEWTYKGRWHEYPLAPAGKTCIEGSIPEDVWQLTSHEGAQNLDPTKHYRAILALRQDLAETPGDTRTSYYLATEVLSCGFNIEAKQMFEKRVEMFGAVHERYLSCLALIDLSTDKADKLKWAWKATEIDPTRLEAAHKLMSIEVTATKYTPQVCALGMAVKNPTRTIYRSHSMVPEQEVYTWKFSDAFSICLYFAGHYELALAEGKLCLSRCPKAHRKRVKANNCWPERALAGPIISLPMTPKKAISATPASALKVINLILYSPSPEYDQMKEILSTYLSKAGIEHYFYCYVKTLPGDEEVEHWRDSKDFAIVDNMLYIRGEESFLPGVLNKTIEALQVVQDKEYDYVIRTNVSSIVDFELFLPYLTAGKYDYAGPIYYTGCYVDVPSGTTPEKHAIYKEHHFIGGLCLVLSKKAIKMLVEDAEVLRAFGVVDDLAIGWYFHERSHLIKRAGVPAMSCVAWNATELQDDKIVYRNKSGDRAVDVANMKRIVDGISEGL